MTATRNRASIDRSSSPLPLGKSRGEGRTNQEAVLQRAVRAVRQSAAVVLGTSRQGERRFADSSDIEIVRQGGLSRYTTSSGRWWSDRTLTPVLEELEATLDRADSEDPDSVVKKMPGRLVWHWSPRSGGVSYLVKAYAICGLRRRMRRDDIASREAISQIFASMRGLRVPKVFAFGRVRASDGQWWCVHCMEWQPLQCMRERFLDEDHRDERPHLLRRATASLANLYRAGCNHVDFGPHAILLSPSGPTEDVIIDFEGCAFLPAPSPRVLASQIGYFGWSVATNRDWLDKDQILSWFDEVFSHLNLPVTEECRRIFEECLRARASLGHRARRT